MATADYRHRQIDAVAKARFVRVSPQKARLVIDLIRGQRAEEALQTLRFTKKRVAKEIEKMLRSAIANAERKAEDAGETLDVDALLRHALLRERRAALEAHASRADGPRLPLPEAHQPHRRGSGRAHARRREPRGSGGGRSGSVQGREGRGPQGAQGHRATRKSKSQKKKKK